MEQEIIYAIFAFLGVLSVILIVLSIKLVQTSNFKNTISNELERLERISRADSGQLRQELGESLLRFNDSVRKSLEERIDVLRTENAQNLNFMRTSVETKMTEMRQDNTSKLEQMRATVDEKLHTTLEKRITESFSLVSERLEKVHHGLGEMQKLAADVDGLNRVLTNVKTRGTWGEMQLGALLEQMLSPEQFIKNAHIKENAQEVVEFAIKLPDGDVLIPIDSKFPIEDYERLIAAVEKNDAALIDAAGTELERRIRGEAKRISEKYVHPPKTTDFGIMFLPTEGLYAEVMRRPGLSSEIQNKHRVTITGPSTLGAFLNSLQMGFRTLAIQKRSGEVWQVLNETKNEFLKYSDWIEDIRKALNKAVKVADDAERRTRAVNRKLEKLNQTNLIDEEQTSPLPHIPNEMIAAVSGETVVPEQGALI